jgi:lysophospholipid acyltransferase (LPLAT)-like uncharacterized protein
MKEHGGFILAFWHGTMLYPWYRHRKRGYLALTSLSKDGDILAKTLKYWKYTVARGSSSKGGREALNKMIRFAASSGAVTITPDGPRGPRLEMKPGAVLAAKKSGKPLILLGVGYKKKKVLRNWDKFEVPYPFSKVRLLYSDPVFIDKALSREETEKRMSELEQEFRILQEKASFEE